MSFYLKMHLVPEYARQKLPDGIGWRLFRPSPTGQVSRRELFKWGIFTAGGALACITV